MRGYHDVTIFASNVPELRSFYQKAGFKMAFSDGDTLVVFVLGDNELAIHTSEQRPTQSIGITVLVDDFAPVVARLREQGIAFDGPKPTRPGMSGISIQDPNQNTIAFLTRD
jgi:hypothetical protein